MNPPDASGAGLRSPHLLAALLENVSDTVMVTDLEGKIRYWNRGAEESLGYRADEIVGAHVGVLYPPGEGEKVVAVRDRVLGGETVSNVEVRERRRDGAIVTILLSIVPLRDESGEVAYLAGIGKDITALRELEQKALAAEKLETVREMIATFNHNVNQPLAVMECYLGMLLAPPGEIDAGKARTYLEKVSGELEKIAGLLRKFEKLEEIRSVEYLDEERMIDIDGEGGRS